MFTSIRSRLWLSYAIVILSALTIVAGVLTAFLIRNPYTYRQAAVRIAAAEGLLGKDPTPGAASVAAEALGVRVLVISPTGELTSDTAPEAGAFRNLLRDRRIRQIAVTRDLDGDAWLYSMRRLPNGDWRIVATARPGLLPVLDVARDELWRPLLQAGLVALLLALGLAYVLARWIGDPLQALMRAAHSTAGSSGSARGALRIQESGPREVRELTQAFNEMLQRVAAAQRAQRDFVANVSHDLKTPLTAIQGFAQALLDGTAETEGSRRKAAETIQREASRMLRLATELLDLARLDAGSGQLRMDEVDLRELLAGLRERFKSMASSTAVVLEMHAPQDLPALRGDGDRLAQAFGNIIENAIKFSPTGGRVEVISEASVRELRVVIRDQGPGIPDGDLERIFDRFYQVDMSRDGGRERGAGLGLAIAREIVEGHGGKIHVRSTLGQGAEFSVHLPRRASSRDVRGAV